MNTNKEVKNIMKKLPNNLRESVVKEINYNLLNQFPFFKKYFSAKTIARILEIMEEKICLSGEIIYN